ncbi:MAG: acyl-CoA reductase [Bacteroidetes bacterium]|nr:acyl-CoA reductase [Bacteroidota bacterium]
MDSKTRISALNRMGKKITSLTVGQKKYLFEETANENPWFTSENIELALLGISTLLNREKLEEWANQYDLNKVTPKKIGVAMAGNIPMVGFHDVLCVLMSGHQLVAKLSSKDSVLMKFLFGLLTEIESGFADQIVIEERLNNVDALIATGSDNTSRYFEYYFRNTPHIIRKNRSSCAVLLGEETNQELTELGKDIFSYFGLGCRNVSKIFVPEKFDFVTLIKGWQKFGSIIHHHKYANNYDYQKSILLINQISFYDSGFLLITESQNLVSPISVLYYETYKDQTDLKAALQAQENKIQCIVSAKGWYDKSVPFGRAQLPGVTDYADGVDTLQFLQSL